MKAITLLALAGSSSLALLLSACASDQADLGNGVGDGSTQGSQDGSAGNDHATSTPPPGQGDAAQPSAQQCSSACQTDTECQSWCPQPDSGVWCCDLSNVCYPSASSICQSSDGGGGNVPD